MNKLIRQDVLPALCALPADCADVGVTSPPYNKQENKKGWLVTNVKYDGARDKMSEADYQAEQIAVLNDLHRIIKPGGSFFYNHKIRWERGEFLHPLAWLGQSKWHIRQEIIWDRALAANIRGWRFWQVEERIYWLYKPQNDNKIGAELQSRHAKMTSIWRFPPARDNPHPAPFPLTLPLRAIYAVMDRSCGVVIDPYCGSGTTLVAAKLMGHDYIGVDISPAYIKMAKARLRQCENERDMWKREKSLHAVRDTFQAKKKNQKHVGRFSPLNRHGDSKLFTK